MIPRGCGLIRTKESRRNKRMSSCTAKESLWISERRPQKIKNFSQALRWSHSSSCSPASMPWHTSFELRSTFTLSGESGSCTLFWPLLSSTYPPSVASCSIALSAGLVPNSSGLARSIFALSNRLLRVSPEVGSVLRHLAHWLGIKLILKHEPWFSIPLKRTRQMAQQTGSFKFERKPVFKFAMLQIR